MKGVVNMLEKTMSQYSIKFSEECFGYSNVRNHNFMYLKQIERHCNTLLSTRKYLFLRDIYEMLGIPITKDSCVVGWIFESDNKIGDNFVKFDIQEDANGIIFIDFNVDGDILERI